MSDGSFILLSKALGAAAGVFVLFAIARPYILPLLRRKRRCPRCHYDLSHSAGMRCSECGYTARTERALHRGPRPRIIITIALLLALGGYASMVTPDVRDRGWPAAVPTPMLIAALPFLRPTLRPPGTGPRLTEHSVTAPPGTVFPVGKPWWPPLSVGWHGRAHDELWINRGPRIDAVPWQRALLVRICQHMNPAAFEHHDPFPNAQHMIVGSTWWKGDPKIAWWPRGVDEPLLRVDMETRPVWPRGATVYARAKAIFDPPWHETFAMTPEGRRIRGVPQSPDGLSWSYQRPLDVHDSLFPVDHDDGLHAVAIASGSGATQNFDIFAQRAARSSAMNALRWCDEAAMSASITYEVVDDVTEILTPLRDFGLDLALRDGLSATWNIARTRQLVGGEALTIYVSRTARWPKLPDDATVVFAFTADILIGDRVVASTSTCRSWAVGASEPVSFISLPVTVQNADVVSALKTGSTARLRIRPAPLLGLRDFTATHFWDGVVEIPLRIQVH